MENSTIYQKNVESASLLENLTFDVKHIPIKRIFDLVFSFCILTIGSPIFLMIALAIYFSSPGPIVYSHMRVGRGGKTFRCYKFRSMYKDADERLQAILSTNETLQMEWDLRHKLKHDPRVTPVGAFLRKTSLDELPQFWNIIKGDLSVVGPRAVVKEELIKFFGPKAIKVLSVRPGLTGLWQVSGRSDTSYSKRIELDEQYIDSHSIKMDVKLICKTIMVMFSTKGAY